MWVFIYNAFVTYLLVFLAVFHDFLKASIHSSLRRHQICQKFLKKKVTKIYCDLALSSGNDQTCFSKWERSINNIESEGSDNLSKTASF